MSHIILMAAALALVAAPIANASVAEAKRDIIQTYDFDPSTMSFDQQAEQAPKLSQLWTRFDESPGTYRQALRSLLHQDGGREMLYCDGGMLLLQKAADATDEALGLRAISKCSLSEIQHTPYFYTMHSRALAGADTLELQFKMLTKPKYQIFVPMHSLTLGQDYCFIYPLLVQDETKYTSRLVARARAEKDPTALNTLLLALYYSALPDAEDAIRSMAQASTLPQGVRERARLMQRRIEEARTTDTAKVYKWIESNDVAIAPNATDSELREGQHKRMRAVSDEALMELDIYTLLIYQARSR